VMKMEKDDDTYKPCIDDAHYYNGGGSGVEQTITNHREKAASLK
jgi:hypothetical protein